MRTGGSAEIYVQNIDIHIGRQAAIEPIISHRNLSENVLRSRQIGRQPQGTMSNETIMNNRK